MSFQTIFSDNVFSDFGIGKIENDVFTEFQI